MNCRVKTGLILYILLHFAFIRPEAQQYILDKKTSSIIIMGTSNLHDWTMDAKNFSGVFTAKINSSKINEINKVTISIDSESILTDNGIMNSKTHNALKSEKYPKIYFGSESVIINSVSTDKYEGITSGILTIAGKSIQVKIPFSLITNSVSTFIAQGKFSLNMTSFDIKPPTALFGTLKTGDKVIVEYDFTFKRDN